MNAVIKSKTRADQAVIDSIKSQINKGDNALQEQLLKIRKELVDLLGILRAL